MPVSDCKANTERARETSETYTCLFVLVENWLEVPIYAGEKDYYFTKQASNRRLK
jgi:hypothetical protein